MPGRESSGQRDEVIGAPIRPAARGRTARARIATSGKLASIHRRLLTSAPWAWHEGLTRGPVLCW